MLTNSATCESEPGYELIKSAIRAGNLRGAKAILKSCVRTNRRDARAWELFGHAHYVSGNFPLAVSAFERAARIASLNANSRACLADSYVMVGNIQQARELLTTLLDESNLPEKLLLKIGIALDSVGCTDLSIRACRQVLRQSPHHAQAYYDLSYYCSRRDYPAATIERLGWRAIKCDPRNAKYRIGLAMRLSQENRLDEAYQLVQDFGMTHLSTMSCAASVERLMALFDHAKDERRMAVCRQRLVELRLRGCGFPCER